jgi:hypothetical protein
MLKITSLAIGLLTTISIASSASALPTPGGQPGNNSQPQGARENNNNSNQGGERRGQPGAGGGRENTNNPSPGGERRGQSEAAFGRRDSSPGGERQGRSEPARNREPQDRSPGWFDNGPSDRSQFRDRSGFPFGAFRDGRW